MIILNTPCWHLERPQTDEGKIFAGFASALNIMRPCILHKQLNVNVWSADSFTFTEHLFCLFLFLFCPQPNRIAVLLVWAMTVFRAILDMYWIPSGSMLSPLLHLLYADSVEATIKIGM